MKWEPSEDSLLIEHYNNLGASRCGFLLGRSEKSVYARVYKLKLTDPYKDRSWSTNQYIAALKDAEINIHPYAAYINIKTPIDHICNICNHKFKAVPSRILYREKGCPNCNIYNNFNVDKPATLYFVSLVFRGNTYYKIGITNRTIRKRFGSDWTKFDMNLIWSEEFTVGLEAKRVEKDLLNKYAKYKINLGCLKSGNSETLTVYIEKPGE